MHNIDKIINNEICIILLKENNEICITMQVQSGYWSTFINTLLQTSTCTHIIISYTHNSSHNTKFYHASDSHWHHYSKFKKPIIQMITKINNSWTKFALEMFKAEWLICKLTTTFYSNFIATPLLKPQCRQRILKVDVQEKYATGLNSLTDLIWLYHTRSSIILQSTTTPILRAYKLYKNI